MSRTEGFNQPDLLNILRKQGGQAPSPPPHAESGEAPKRPAPALPHTLSQAAGRRPSRVSRRDVAIILTLVGVVAALVLAVIFRPKGVAPAGMLPRPSAPPPAASRPPATPAGTPTASQPAGPGTLKVYTRAPAGSGRSFWTLILVTYPASKEPEARATCDSLRGKGAEFSDLFLYRTTSSQSGAQQLQICLGHYDPNRNPLIEDAKVRFQKKVCLMPNAAGRREFESCYFHKLSVAEP